MFCGDCVKMGKDFAQNFKGQKNCLLRQEKASSHTSFFTTEYVTKNNMTVVFHPLYFSLYPPFEDKTERRPF
jgi:hypothetical protein